MSLVSSPWKKRSLAGCQFPVAAPITDACLVLFACPFWSLWTLLSLRAPTCALNQHTNLVSSPEAETFASQLPVAGGCFYYGGLLVWCFARQFWKFVDGFVPTCPFFAPWILLFCLFLACIYTLLFGYKVTFRCQLSCLRITKLLFHFPPEPLHRYHGQYTLFLHLYLGHYFYLRPIFAIYIY